MTDLWIESTLTVFVWIFAFIPLIYALNHFMIFLGSLTYSSDSDIEGETKKKKSYPNITVMIATFNERNIIRRTLDRLNKLRYPKNRIQVLIADDSTDGTEKILRKKLGQLKKSGFKTTLVHRKNREGFKTGALRNALKHVKGRYVMLLDADSFVFLDTIGKGVDIMENDSSIGFVSYRMDHRKRKETEFTKVYALFTDIFQIVEHKGRYALGFPYGYHGGSAMLRTKAIKESGGWDNDTLVDDGDLSIRLFLNGWKSKYLFKEKIYAEVPENMLSWKKQQGRIAQGYGECIRRYLFQILFSKLTLLNKLEMLMLYSWSLSGISWIMLSILTSIMLLSGMSIIVEIFDNVYFMLILLSSSLIMMLVPAFILGLSSYKFGEKISIISKMSGVVSSMLFGNSVSFMKGILGIVPKKWFRTPKGEANQEKAKVTQKRDLIYVTETLISIVFILTALKAFYDSHYIISLIMMLTGGQHIKEMLKDVGR